MCVVKHLRFNDEKDVQESFLAILKSEATYSRLISHEKIKSVYRCPDAYTRLLGQMPYPTLVV